MLYQISFLIITTFIFINISKVLPVSLFFSFSFPYLFFIALKTIQNTETASDHINRVKQRYLWYSCTTKKIFVFFNFLAFGNI